jgi:hypothetical protein
MACLRWRNKCEDSNSEVTGTYRNRDKMEKHIAKIGTPKWRTHWINGQYWVMTVNTQEKHKFNEVNPIIIHPQNHHNISYIFIYRCYKHHPPKIGLWLGFPTWNVLDVPSIQLPDFTPDLERFPQSSLAKLRWSNRKAPARVCMKPFRFTDFMFSK